MPPPSAPPQAAPSNLDEDAISEYLQLQHRADAFNDCRGLRRSAHPGAPLRKMEDWLANPELLKADADAEYAAVIEIDLAE